jgi:putative peptidoglycan lipid II flippase
MSVSYGVGAVVALWMLRHRLEGFGAGRVLRLHVRVGVAAGVAAGAGWTVVHLVGGLPDTGFARAALICTVVGLLMTGIYVGLLRLMRVRELDALLRPLFRRVGRRVGRSA